MTCSGAASQRSFPVAFGVFLLLACAGLLSVYLAGPPFPVPATAPGTEFSAERALEFDRHIASAPHPAGSAANEKVRNYIVETLRSMGIAAEVYAGTYVAGHSAAEIKNVLARIPGTANTKAVALEAHYDSVAYGPGAADDGAGVSAMLETARALKAGPLLMNDVILVFTDAEEGGLLGAKVFGKHPWFKDIGLLLNLESRGNRGPSLMFETSEQNGWIVEQMIKSGIPMRANSMMYEIYKRMPFNSDLSVLKSLGMKGINIAFIENFGHYHTVNDNPGNLSLASLQHHGAYTLGVARHFGNLPLDEVTAPDVVYFNTIGSHMVMYSVKTNHALAILTVAAFLAMLTLGFARRHLSLGGFLGGIAAFLLTVLCAAAVTVVLLGIAYGPSQLYRLYRYGVTDLPDLRVFYRNDAYGWAFFLVTCGLMALSYNGWRRFVRTQNLAAGALAWWLAAMFGTELFLPGAAYLFTWPLLLACISLGVLFLSRDTMVLSASRLTCVTALVLPGFLLWVPTFGGTLSAVFIIFAPLLMVLPCLLLGTLIPQLDLMARGNKWWLPAVLTTAGLLIWAGAMATNTVSPLRPNLDSLSYGLDLDTGQAYWLSGDEKTDEWTSQFFPAGTPRVELSEFMPWAHELYLKAPAPVVSMAGPSITVLQNAVRDNRREIVFRVVCPDKPSSLYFRVTGVKVHSARVFGEEVRGGEDWGIHFRLMPKEGVELTLKVDSSTPLKVGMIEEHLALPASLPIPPRPKYIIPEPNTVHHSRSLGSERMLVKKSFEFPLPSNPNS
jgi:hypothetical protein